MKWKSKCVALVVAVVVLLAVGGCGDDSSDRGSATSTTPAPTTASSTAPSSTAPPTTSTPKTCDSVGALGTEQTGPGALTKPTATMVNVQIQASDCKDEIAFAFTGGTPSWKVSYQSGPFAADPSGMPITVTGTAYLVVRFEHASGTDQSVSPPNTPYPGSSDLHPGAPGEVHQVVKSGDFEGVMTWIVGLDSSRPFTVAAHGADAGLQQVVIEVPAKAPRATTCTNTGKHLRVHLPTGWFTELNPEWGPCTLFGAAPFVIIPQSDAMTFGASATLEQQPFPGSPDDTTKVLTTKDATVNGRHERIVEVESTGAGLLPAGTRTYTYVIDWGTFGTLRISASGTPSPAYDANKAGVDALATSAELVP